MQRRPLEAAPGEKPCGPSGARPPRAALGGLPPPPPALRRCGARGSSGATGQRGQSRGPESSTQGVALPRGPAPGRRGVIVGGRKQWAPSFGGAAGGTRRRSVRPLGAAASLQGLRGEADLVSVGLGMGVCLCVRLLGSTSAAPRPRPHWGAPCWGAACDSRGCVGLSGLAVCPLPALRGWGMLSQAVAVVIFVHCSVFSLPRSFLLGMICPSLFLSVFVSCEYF